MIKYAIRHKATNRMMPRAERDTGYSHWTPGTPGNQAAGIWMDGMYNAIPGSIRLLETEQQAQRCIREWAKGTPTWENPKSLSNILAIDAWTPKRIFKDKRDPKVLEVVPMQVLPLPVTGTFEYPIASRRKYGQ